MYGKCPLHGSRWIIEVTMGEVRSLVMFHQVDGKEFYDQSLKIVEIDL